MAVSFRGTHRGDYELVVPPNCTICSYPLSSKSAQCVRPTAHATSLRKIYTIGIYYSFDGIQSRFLSKHINNLKGYINKAEPLGLGIAELINKRDIELLKFDCIVPVPQEESELHTDGDSGQKFNQAEKLAEWISNTVHIPIVSALVKLKPHSQQNRSATERSETTVGLYQCKRDLIDRKSVLLVDDVTTSGSTLVRCAEELTKAKANEVRAYVCGINNFR